jgi:hypothetical protein
MMKIPAVIALLAISTSALANPPPSQCAMLDTEQARNLFERWNTSLQTGDPAKVAANRPRRQT